MKKEKITDEIGFVASGSNPQKMKFYSLQQINVDYVMIEIEENRERIIYEIIDVDAYNSKMDDMELVRYILPGEDYTKYNIYRANAKPLGMIKNNELCFMKRWFVAPPGKVIKLADNQEIAMVYGVEQHERKQEIGRIIRHEQIAVWLDFPQLLTTHMAIVGRSGQGKSNLVKIFLKNAPLKYMVFTKVNEYTNIQNASIINLEYTHIDTNARSLKKIFELNNSEMRYLSEYLKKVGCLKKIHTYELAENIRKYFSLTSEEKFQQVSMFVETPQINSISLPRYVESLCKKIESISMEVSSEKGCAEVDSSCIINMQSLSDKEEEITLYTYLLPILEKRRKCYKDIEHELSLEDRLVIFIEEAHNYIPSSKSSFCKEVIQQIAREGRKLGIHLVLLSQRPRHLDPTALSQCGSIVSFNLTNPEDIDYLMKNANFYGDYYKNIIGDLKIGECTIVSDYLTRAINCKVNFEMPSSEG